LKLKSKIFVIAGSDSSGGAGIQADIKTITSLGSYAMTAITAITSQNTTGVLSISKVPINEIKRQIEFTSKDIRPDAIKIGMLHSKKVIETVINSLKKIKVKKIILDPVMVAKGGTKLVDDKSIEIIKTKLMNRVSLITPNIPEAEILSKIKIKTTDDMIIAGKKLLSFGAKNVLIKGGHLRAKYVYDLYLNKSDDGKIIQLLDLNTEQNEVVFPNFSSEKTFYTKHGDKPILLMFIFFIGLNIFGKLINQSTT